MVCDLNPMREKEEKQRRQSNRALLRTTVFTIKFYRNLRFNVTENGKKYRSAGSGERPIIPNPK
jgi:hypothetical protein